MNLFFRSALLMFSIGIFSCTENPKVEYAINAFTTNDKIVIRYYTRWKPKENDTAFFKSWLDKKELYFKRIEVKDSIICDEDWIYTK